MQARRSPSHREQHSRPLIRGECSWPRNSLYLPGIHPTPSDGPCRVSVWPGPTRESHALGGSGLLVIATNLVNAAPCLDHILSMPAN
jgi:hypothetical protein